MGQILDRIFRIAKAETIKDEKTVSFDLDSDDNELKRTINSLKEENSNHFNQKDSKATSASSPTLDQAYKILEVNPDAGIVEIKSAYKKKMLEYHPDRVSNLGEEIKNLAEKKTKQINESFITIKKYKGF
jgi:DnaJ-domain-containing protein 1